MMQRDEQYARRILKRHRSVIEEAHKRYQGQILQYFGDGTLSIFSSAISAVECAVEIQIDLRKEPEVPLRIGIHTGDISYDHTGAFGDGVNIASRVENECLPGAVYITAKVYDDIKNHSWLAAADLGAFNLRNIRMPVVLYAITSKGLPIPVMQDRVDSPEIVEASILDDPPLLGKKKFVAALLAFFLGVFGVHRFYLGQRFLGFLYAVTFMILMVATAESRGAPFIAAIGLVAFVDAILLAVRPQAEFDRKYNIDKKAVKESRRATRKQLKIKKDTRISHRPAKKVVRRDPVEAMMERAMRKFVTGRYVQAIDYFDRILDIDGENAEAHFRLACCFSMNQEKKDAYFHLSEAVRLGYDKTKIPEETTLKYLRSQSGYIAFAANNFNHPLTLPEPKPDLLESERFDPKVLDKIELLGERLEKGELSRQEFDAEKQKLLGGDQ